MSGNISEEDWNAVIAEREAPVENQAPAEPPQEPTPEPTPEPQTEPTPAEGAEPKPALDPEIQAKLQRLDEVVAALPHLVNELREAKGRIGALQSRLDKAQVEQPSQKQVAAAVKDPEKWESLKKDFPEWGEAIAEFVESKLGGAPASTAGPTAEQIEHLVAQRAEATTAAAVRQLNEKLVAVKYRDWKDMVRKPEFIQWYQQQPNEIKALAGSEDGLDAIAMLDKYVDDTKTLAPAVQEADERRQRLAAAASSGKPGPAGVVSKKFEDMTPQEQWDYMARQREKQQGR